MDLYKVEKVSDGITPKIVGLIVYKDEKRSMRFFIHETIVNKNLFDLTNHKINADKLTYFHVTEDDYIKYINNGSIITSNYTVKGSSSNEPDNIIPMLF